jgi:CMP-N-acetylneuraminic acid synthetase
MRVLWLVAARSGSKSIPHKNIQELAGHPLLAYRVRTALTLAGPEDVWITTDSDRYAAIAESYGATVPFVRPAELATDSTGSADVVLHAMDVARSMGRDYDAVGLLEPTSPFVLPRTLSKAVERLGDATPAQAIVATRAVRPSSFYVQRSTLYLDQLAARLATGVLRRQDEEVEVTPSGGFYIARWDSFLHTRTFYTPTTLSHLVDETEELEIDEPIDWEWANFLVASGRVTPDLFGLDPEQAGALA